MRWHAMTSGISTRRDRLRRWLWARAFPSGWSLVFGIVSAACFAVLVVTGIFLLFYYHPSNHQVVYHGSYAPLQGVQMSKGLSSTMHISFEVRAGLLMRQAHHWAALLLLASLMLQMLRTFFTGAFRRPRRLAWVLLCGVFILALVAGWSGYGLPDDTLAGTGQRIVEGITIGLPIVGRRVTGLLFGGEFPGQILAHLYWLHVLVVPLALAILVALRLRLALRQRPAQVAGPGRTEDNVVGLRWKPTLIRATGLFLMTVGLIFTMAGTATIAPIWLNGPASPTDASAGSQPDWYMAFLDGALRLTPSHWEFTGLGGTWPMPVLIPQAVVGLFLVLIIAYPLLEERLTGDRGEHHILDRPRDAPRRTALGVAGLVFYLTLWAAAGSDVIATHLGISLESQVNILRTNLLVGPVLAYYLTRAICRGLQERDRDMLEHGIETGRLTRRPDGGYVEVRRPLSRDQRSRRVGARDAAHELE